MNNISFTDTGHTEKESKEMHTGLQPQNAKCWQATIPTYINNLVEQVEIKDSSILFLKLHKNINLELFY